MAAGPGASPSPRLLDSLKRLAGTGLAILQTRLEIFGTELEEERVRLVRLVVLAVAVVFLFNAALALAAAWVVVALWESYRHATIGLLALLLAGAGVALLLYVRHGMRHRPKPFATTLAELAKDREFLSRRREDAPGG